MTDLEILVGLIASVAPASPPKRKRGGRRKPRFNSVDKGGCRRRAVLNLIRELTPRQLELFDRWQLHCAGLGVEISDGERADYLRGLIAA